MDDKKLAQTLDTAQMQLSHAEEINGLEALTEAQEHGKLLSSTMDIGVLIGRIQMAQSYVKMSNAVNFSTLKKIKESKEYKKLKGCSFEKMTSVGKKNIVLNGTWAEFCELIGSSKSTVDEQLVNIDTFGEEALNAMQTIGIGSRELRRLRKLPEEEVKAIVDGTEVKVADKHEALELIEDMSAKHRQESQKLKGQIATLQQESNSHERLLAEKDKKINALSKKLDKPMTAVQKRQVEEKHNRELLEKLNLASLSVDSGMATLFDAIHTIKDSKHPTDIDTACEDALFRVLNRFLDLAAELGINAHVQQHLESWYTEQTSLFDVDK